MIIPNKDINENPIYSPTFEYNKDLNGRWKTKLYTAIAGNLNFFDEQITTEIELRGGWYELLDDPSLPTAIIGDYIEFSVIDKDDVLGLFSTYGLIVGQDILEISKFVVTDYINIYNNTRQKFYSNSTSSLVAGLYFRTSYNSTGTTDVKFKRTVQYYEL